MKLIQSMIVIIVVLVALLVGMTTVVQANGGCGHNPHKCQPPPAPPEPNPAPAPLPVVHVSDVRGPKCDVTLFVSAQTPISTIEYKGEGTLCLVLPRPGAYNLSVQNLK